MKKLIKIFVISVLIWFIPLFIIPMTNNNKIEAITTTQSEDAPQTNYKVAPSFNLPGLDGKKYSLNSVKGTPLVINFWASWCGPCRIEAPELVKLHNQYGDKIKIYAINVTESDSARGAEQFVEKYGFQFPVLFDKGDNVSTKYGVVAIPTTFFINKDGKIVDMITGYGGPNVLAEKFEALSSQ